MECALFTFSSDSFEEVVVDGKFVVQMKCGLSAYLELYSWSATRSNADRSPKSHSESSLHNARGHSRSSISFGEMM